MNKDSECNYTIAITVAIERPLKFWDLDSHEGIIEPVAGQILVKLLLNNFVSSDTTIHMVQCQDLIKVPLIGLTLA